MAGFSASAPHNKVDHITHQMWCTTFDAGNPPVRFGGRGGINPPSLPQSQVRLHRWLRMLSQKHSAFEHFVSLCSYEFCLPFGGLIGKSKTVPCDCMSGEG